MKAFSKNNICFLFVLILGTVLRLILLGTVPAGMHQDESLTAWNAYAIFHEHMDSDGNIFPVYVAGWGDGQSALYIYITTLFVALGGGHVTPFLARLPQALIGILTLAAVYGIVRRTLGQKPALWAMFLLSICPWHVMMCRWGLEANIAPAFLMFGLYFFILSLENEKYLLLSALFYGLSLYGYAVIWPIVPFMLLLQVGYGLFHQKLHLNKYSIISSIILFLLALPLILFILVNSGIIPEIKLPFMTIPFMVGYRGGEVAFSIGQMYSNLRKALSLLWHQNTGAPYDILLPWGLFYDIGRIFIVIGAICLSCQTIRSLLTRRYLPETFLFIQLLGGVLECLLVTAVLQQINSLYIPLVLCEMYGIWCVMEMIAKRKQIAAKCTSGILVSVYLICLIGFQKDYYGEYKDLVNAYFAAGVKECVEYAQDVCRQKNLSTITVEKGAQWPRLLLFLETLPSEYLASVEYDVAPAPASFVSDGILIRTRINYDQIDNRSVYIIYYTDEEIFSDHFDLIRFYDWYVAVPK